jgi:hypothetical protein
MASRRPLAAPLLADDAEVNDDFRHRDANR